MEKERRFSSIETFHVLFIYQIMIDPYNLYEKSSSKIQVDLEITWKIYLVCLYLHRLNDQLKGIEIRMVKM